MQSKLFSHPSNMPKVNLHDFDLVIINSSGGKDSSCAIFEVCRIAEEQNFDKSKIVVSHQELLKVEWKGVKELVQEQCDYFGLKCFYSMRRNKDGYNENLLEYAVRRGKFPSSKQRWCTSDFKRAAGARVVTAVTKDLGQCRVLYVFGFRAAESPARSKRLPLAKNKMLTTKKREVLDWLPIHDWSEERVWNTIKANNIPYHYAYDLGMPRLSCCFCIFAPFDALVIAGHENRDLLKEYVETERKIGHDFRHNFKIASVLEAVEKGYMPKNIKNWTM